MMSERHCANGIDDSMPWIGTPSRGWVSSRGTPQEVGRATSRSRFRTSVGAGSFAPRVGTDSASANTAISSGPRFTGSGHAWLAALTTSLPMPQGSALLSVTVDGRRLFPARLGREATSRLPPRNSEPRDATIVTGRASSAVGRVGASTVDARDPETALTDVTIVEWDLNRSSAIADEQAPGETPASAPGSGRTADSAVNMPTEGATATWKSRDRWPALILVGT